MPIAIRTDLGAGGTRTAKAYDDWHAARVLLGRGAIAIPIRPPGGAGFMDTELVFDLAPVPDMSIEEYRELPSGSGARIVKDGVPVYLVLPDEDGSLRPIVVRASSNSGGCYWFEDHDEPRFPEGAREALVAAAAEVGMDLSSARDGAVARAVQRFLVDEGGRTFADVFSAMSGYRIRHVVGTNMSGDAVDRWMCVAEGTKEQDSHYVDASGLGGWIDLAGTVGRAPTVSECAPGPMVDISEEPAARLALAWIDNMPHLFGDDWIVQLRERTYGPRPEAEAVSAPSI